MRKKLYAILIVIAIMIVTIVYLNWLIQPGLKIMAQKTPDHQLLCEVLKPEMSEEEVLSTLRQVGDFKMNRGEWGTSVQLIISFTDQELEDKYGRFYLFFFDNKYIRAGKTSLIGDSGDPSDILCDFYQEPVFITDTP